MTPEEIVSRLIGYAIRADRGEDVADDAERFLEWVGEDRSRAGAALGEAVGALWATAAAGLGVDVGRPVLRLQRGAQDLPPSDRIPAAGKGESA